MQPATLDNCPSCGSDSAHPIHQREFHGRTWTLARCMRCTLHYTSPTPSPEDLEAFYAGDYHGELRRPGGAEAAFGLKYSRYAETLSRHLVSGRVVDVGCSTGLLVRMLADRGFRAEGVEMNTHSAAWGSTHYGVPIHTESLASAPFKKGSLDAVLLTDVLEHTPHPRVFLQGVGDLLAPGGFVFVTFPDIASVESRARRLLAAALRREWLWNTCHIPLHVWEFTRQTAEACFIEAGFRVVEFRRSQAAAEREPSALLNALTSPLRALQWSPLARHLGTQMEFLIQKVPVRDPDVVVRTASERRRVAA